MAGLAGVGAVAEKRWDADFVRLGGFTKKEKGREEQGYMRKNCFYNSAHKSFCAESVLRIPICLPFYEYNKRKSSTTRAQGGQRSLSSYRCISALAAQFIIHSCGFLLLTKWQPFYPGALLENNNKIRMKCTFHHDPIIQVIKFHIYRYINSPFNSTSPRQRVILFSPRFAIS